MSCPDVPAPPLALRLKSCVHTADLSFIFPAKDAEASLRVPTVFVLQHTIQLGGAEPSALGASYDIEVIAAPLLMPRPTLTSRLTTRDGNRPATSIQTDFNLVQCEVWDARFLGGPCEHLKDRVYDGSSTYEPH